MKKLLVFVLLTSGWWLVFFIVQNPAVRTVHHYHALVDFGAIHVVDLGNNVKMSFRKVNGKEVWESEPRVTVAQFRQYQMNYQDLIPHEEKVSLGIHHPPIEIVTDISFHDVDDFCRWMTWRECSKKTLPSGYHFVMKWEESILSPNGFIVQLKTKALERKDSLYEKKLEIIGPFLLGFMGKHPFIAGTVILISAGWGISFVAGKIADWWEAGDVSSTAET